jgi:hypothetical protein
VTNEPWGLGIQDELSGTVTHVDWPPRFSAVAMDGQITLRDHNLHVVANVGDTVRVPGELGPDGAVWFACRNVSVLSPT